MKDFNHPFSDLLKNYLTFEYEHKLNGGPKEYNRASDIGKDYFTLYHKRIGTPYSNHPTPEGLGKMMAGNVFHLFIQDKFEQMGILRSKETTIEIPELNVRGHFDLRVGGSIDFTQPVFTNTVGPRFIADVKVAWLNALREEFGSYVPEFMADIKSISSFMFDRMEINGWLPMEHHALQQTEYWIGASRPKVPQLIFYLCRDDFRMHVVEFNPHDYENAVVEFWTKLNLIVESGRAPEPEEPIVYDEQGFGSLNWHILYSPYLTMITGCKTKEDFKEKYEPAMKEANKLLAERLEWEAIQKEFEKASVKDLEKIVADGYEASANFGRNKRGRLIKRLLEERKK